MSTKESVEESEVAKAYDELYGVWGPHAARLSSESIAGLVGRLEAIEGWLREDSLINLSRECQLYSAEVLRHASRKLWIKAYGYDLPE